MTDGGHRRRRRTVVPCADAPTVGAALPGAASAAEPGLWVGSTYMKATRATRWVGASDTSRGDFWFRVDSHGNLHGFAVVAGEPTFDAERLNNLERHACGTRALAGPRARRERGRLRAGDRHVPPYGHQQGRPRGRHV